MDKGWYFSLVRDLKRLFREKISQEAFGHDAEDSILSDRWDGGGDKTLWA